MTKSPNPFRWSGSSPEVIRLVVMMYVRYPLSLRNVEDLLFERGIDICHERYGCGGTGLVRCSLARSGDAGSITCASSPIGAGIWMRCASASTARCATFAQERHLVSRKEYRERRSAALAEWRAVMG